MDGAAKQFTDAYDSGLIPMEFVNSMRKKGQLIMGIGHRVKSVSLPDLSVIESLVLFTIVCLFYHYNAAFKKIFLFKINNPDKRVEILKEFAKQNFPSTPLLDYALQVEKITTSKVGSNVVCTHHAGL